VKEFFLSPYTLTIFLDCPRCFWFHVIKGQDYRRPEVPTSTLPRGMDSLIKKYFDQYRKNNLLPPEISGVVKGKLVDKEVIEKWRYWKTGLAFIDSDGSKLFGVLDECLVSNGVYTPVDYKTRGFSLKEDSTSYYTLQMSCYCFLLRKNGYRISNYAYLVFYIPQEFQDKGVVQFNIEVKRVETLPLEKVYSIFRDALDVLALNEPPPPDRECKFCSWALRVTKGGQTQLRLF